MALARIVRTAFVTACVLSGWASAAVAQTAWGGEIAGGYQAPRASGDDADLHGWFLSGGFDLTPALALVGEVSVAGDRTVIEIPFLPELGLELGRRDTTILGGVQAAYRKRRLSLFGRSLFGRQRSTGDIQFLEVGLDLAVRGWALQLGGGIDIHGADRVAIRVQGDWRRSRFGDVTVGGFPGADFPGEISGDGLSDGNLFADVGFPGLPAFTRNTPRFAVGLAYRFGRP